MALRADRLMPLPACALALATGQTPDAVCPRCLEASLGAGLRVDDAAARQLSQAMVDHHYAAREVIQNAGDEAVLIGVITDGLAAVILHTEDGRRQITGFLTEGDLFGISSAESYHASVEAITKVKACLFPRSLFETVVTSNADCSLRVIRLVSHELAEASHHQMVLGRLTARERVAAFIDDLARRIGQSEGDDQMIRLNMTRTDIADYLGLSMEHVSRGFNQLAKEGLIELKTPQNIFIRKSEAIRQLAQG